MLNHWALIVLVLKRHLNLKWLFVPLQKYELNLNCWYWTFSAFQIISPCKTNVSSHHSKFQGVKMVLSENTAPPNKYNAFRPHFPHSFHCYNLTYPWVSLFSDRPREVFPGRKQLRYRHVLGFNRPGRSGSHSIWDADFCGNLMYEKWWKWEVIQRNWRILDFSCGKQSFFF
jgi:hypothetical protein